MYKWTKAGLLAITTLSRAFSEFPTHTLNQYLLFKSEPRCVQMARASTLLLIAGCVMLAALSVQAEKFNFSFYEHDETVNQIEVFGPKDSNDDVGKGYIYTNRATKTREGNSEEYGTVAGLYYVIDKRTEEEVSSIRFKDINEKGGRFADAELHIRGLWNLKKDGSDEPKQELAIVGGSYGLASAYGKLSYTKVPRTADVWYVVGEFQIDDCALANF